MLTAECKVSKGIFEYLNGDIEATKLFKLWLAIDYPFNNTPLFLFWD